MRYYTTFAQAYGQNAYSNCAYNQNTGTCTTSSGSTTANSGGGLTNTGFMVVIIVTIACMAIVVAILVRFWRRTRQPQLQVEPVEDEEVEEIDARNNQ